MFSGSSSEAGRTSSPLLQVNHLEFGSLFSSNKGGGGGNGSREPSPAQYKPLSKENRGAFDTPVVPSGGTGGGNSRLERDSGNGSGGSIFGFVGSAGSMGMMCGNDSLRAAAEEEEEEHDDCNGLIPGSATSSAASSVASSEDSLFDMLNEEKL